MILLEGLFELFPCGEVADVASDFLRARAEPSDGVGNKLVDFTGVGLGGDGVAAAETSLLAELLVELVALLGVAVENLEERCLGSGGALGAAELEVVLDVLYGLKVEQEVLRPLRCSLADGDQLSGLQVSVSQGGLGLPLQSEFGQVVDDLGKLGEDQVHGIAHEDELGVVSHVTACCLDSC